MNLRALLRALEHATRPEPPELAQALARRWNELPAHVRTPNQMLGQRMSALTAFIPYKRNDLVALWHQRGVIEEERYEAEGTHIVGRVPGIIAGQLAPFRVEQEQAEAAKG